MSNQYSGTEGQRLFFTQQAIREKKIAYYVIVIDKDGYVISSWTNSKYQLNVIAVIGPCEYEGLFFEEVVLLEIGRGRLYPYRRSEQVNGRKKVISQRRKIASLTIKQCVNLWPILRDVIERDAVISSSSWSTTTWYTGSKTSVDLGIHQIGSTQLLKGVYYSISIIDNDTYRGDRYFASTVFRSEIKNRQIVLVEDMRKLVDEMTKSLSEYTQGPFDTDWLKCELKKGRKSDGCIDWWVTYLDGKNKLTKNQRRLLPHQYAIMIDLFDKTEHRMDQKMFQTILEYLNVDMAEVEYWKQLMTKDCELLFSNDVFIRVPPIPTDRKTNQSHRDEYLVFEVIPKPCMRDCLLDDILLPQIDFDRPDEDIPF